MKKTPGTFLIELFIDNDGNSCTLWVSDVMNPSSTKNFDFVGVEADSAIGALDDVYRWISSLGYKFESSEIIVCDLQEFGILLGKQGEDSLWSRDFADFISICAGAWGMTYSDAFLQMIRPIAGLVGEDRYRKMSAIILLIRSQAKGYRDFLAKAAYIAKSIDETRQILGRSGLAEKIWHKSGDDFLYPD